MKVKIISDSKGEVVAAIEQAANEIKLEPVIPAGHKSEEIEVPDEDMSDVKTFFKKYEGRVKQ